jgi:hypothetical protein
MKLATLFDNGWELDDGEECHREAPETFYIPPLNIRQSLAVNQIVKLMFRISVADEDGTRTEEVERMWVVIEQPLLDGKYLGVLDNDPYCTAGMRAGMKVVFEPRHVIQVHAGAA